MSLVVILKKKTGVTLSKDNFKPRQNIMTSLLKIGIPVALQDGFIQIAFIVITIYANKRGLNDAAAVGIVEKIIAILFLVPSSMLQTVSALSAQNIEAGKHDRARLTLRYASVMAVTWGIAVCILMQFSAEPFVGIFSDNMEVVRLGGQYMRGYIWDSIICVRIPLSYFAAKYFTDTSSSYCMDQKQSIHKFLP